MSNLDIQIAKQLEADRRIWLVKRVLWLLCFILICILAATMWL